MATKIIFRCLKYPNFRNRRPKILVWCLFFNRFRRRKSIFVAQCNFCLQFGDEKLFFGAQSNMFLQFCNEKPIFVAQRYHCNLCLHFDYIWRKYMQLPIVSITKKLMTHGPTR